MITLVLGCCLVAGLLTIAFHPRFAVLREAVTTLRTAAEVIFGTPAADAGRTDACGVVLNTTAAPARMSNDGPALISKVRLPFGHRAVFSDQTNVIHGSGVVFTRDRVLTAAVVSSARPRHLVVHTATIQTMYGPLIADALLTIDLGEGSDAIANRQTSLSAIRTDVGQAIATSLLGLDYDAVVRHDWAPLLARPFAHRRMTATLLLVRVHPTVCGEEAAVKKLEQLRVETEGALSTVRNTLSSTQSSLASRREALATLVESLTRQVWNGNASAAADELRTLERKFSLPQRNSRGLSESLVLQMKATERQWKQTMDFATRAISDVAVLREELRRFQNKGTK